MNRRFRVGATLLLTILSVVGCSNQPAGYSRVHGKLSYKGQAAAGAFVVLQLEGSKPQAADVGLSTHNISPSTSSSVYLPFTPARSRASTFLTFSFIVPSCF